MAPPIPPTVPPRPNPRPKCTRERIQDLHESVSNRHPQTGYRSVYKSVHSSISSLRCEAGGTTTEPTATKTNISKRLYCPSTEHRAESIGIDGVATGLTSRDAQRERERAHSPSEWAHTSAREAQFEQSKNVVPENLSQTSLIVETRAEDPAPLRSGLFYTTARHDQFEHVEDAAPNLKASNNESQSTTGCLRAKFQQLKGIFRERNEIIDLWRWNSNYDKSIKQIERQAQREAKADLKAHKKATRTRLKTKRAKQKAEKKKQKEEWKAMLEPDDFWEWLKTRLPNCLGGMDFDRAMEGDEKDSSVDLMKDASVDLSTDEQRIRTLTCEMRISASMAIVP